MELSHIMHTFDGWQEAWTLHLSINNRTSIYVFIFSVYNIKYDVGALDTKSVSHFNIKD